MFHHFAVVGGEPLPAPGHSLDGSSRTACTGSKRILRESDHRQEVTNMEKTIYRLLALALLAVLAACGSMQAAIDDCKSGDWNVMGQKDGAAGAATRFDQRKLVCMGVASGNVTTVAASQYQDGWARGNHDYWRAAGRGDGSRGLSTAAFAERASSAEVVRNQTPLNRPAWDQGWSEGITVYWTAEGEKDGTAGLPFGRSATRGTEAVGRGIPFSADGYRAGWEPGNHAWWTKLGFEDAQAGIPETNLQKRESDAQRAAVALNTAAYRESWQRGLVEYWGRTGTDDATHGKTFGMREAEARRKGLQILEPVYRQNWEARLVQYWQDAGRQDGFGQPDRLEQRIGKATSDGVFVIPATRDLYRRNWESENARYCSGDNAFSAGQATTPFSFDVCRVEFRPALKRAWASGRDYEVVAARRAAVLAEIDTLERGRDRLRERIQRLEREGRADQKQEREAVQKRDRERSEVADRVRDADRKLEDLRRRDDRYEKELRDLKRDSFA
jgi:hypothetical protein